MRERFDPGEQRARELITANLLDVISLRLDAEILCMMLESSSTVVSEIFSCVGIVYMFTK